MRREVKEILQKVDINFSEETVEILDFMLKNKEDPLNLVVILEEIKREFDL